MYWTQVVSDQRPNMVCTLSMPQASPPHIRVSGMVDTGADGTIISTGTWPLILLSHQEEGADAFLVSLPPSLPTCATPQLSHPRRCQ